MQKGNRIRPMIGGGTEHDIPVKVAPGVSLETIIARTDRLAERFDDLRRQQSPGTERELTPDPETLYPGRLRAAMPEPSELFGSSLAVRLTGAEKDALDLLAAWSLCTTDQLAGLMGGVTRRRANQILNSLTGHSLVFTDGQRHALTDEGLSYLARPRSPAHTSGSSSGLGTEWPADRLPGLSGSRF